jgi:hypothetical protein
VEGRDEFTWNMDKSHSSYIYYRGTPWTLFASYPVPSVDKQDQNCVVNSMEVFLHALETDAFVSLLEHGADPDAKFRALTHHVHTV